MKAVRIHKFGGPEVMQVEDVPTPSPQAGQVLVRLAAAGLNYIDVYQQHEKRGPMRPFCIRSRILQLRSNA